MLKLCESFFNSLDREGVIYCHWKSNSHLSKALNGETDLDLLVEEDSRAGFESVLKKYEFKKLFNDPAKRIPYMEDYLGLDFETGKLIHLHLHYRLILGERHIKNHHLPIETFIFENLDTKLGVKIPKPEIELILLVIRANFKLGFDTTIKHLIANVIGKSFTPYPKDIEAEFRELIASSNMERLKSNLKKMELPLSEPLFMHFLGRISNGSLSFHDVLKTRREVYRKLSSFRRDRGKQLIFRYYLFLLKSSPVIRKMFQMKRKTLPGKGMVISIVGADGSGKSTLVKELTLWLSWKLEVKKLYFGIPKTLTVKGWSFLIRIFKKIKLVQPAALLNALFWIYIARVRLVTSQKSREFSKRGKAVITDRFPLREFWGMEEPMDGPRLGNFRESAVKDLFMKEEKIYNAIERPDHVFVLQADLEELRKRKADLDITKHKLKADAVNSLKTSPFISVINANRPYPEVLKEIKIKIWGLI